MVQHHAGPDREKTQTMATKKAATKTAAKKTAKKK